MDKEILGPADLRRCSLRRESGTNYLVVKDYPQRLGLAFSRCTRSAFDWSERSETVGTTHAASISEAVGNVQGR